MPLREPASVVSNVPTYSTLRAIRSTWDRLASATPQGIGEPIILCPLIAMLSTPAAKSHGCASSTKGNTMPLKAASAWM